MEGIFRPHCNSNGYYAARQCDTKTPRQCWCVDKHGIEVDGTRQDDDHMPECGTGRKLCWNWIVICLFLDDIEDSRTRK